MHISPNSRTNDLSTYLSINQSISFISRPETFLNIKAQISHQYKRAGKIRFLRVLISNFLDSLLGKRNTVNGMVADVFSVQSVLNTFKIATLLYLVCSRIFALFLRL